MAPFDTVREMKSIATHRYSIAAICALVVAAVAAVLLHRHDGWGQPVESAAAVAAALLTAITAAAAAASAASSSRAARDATAALEQHFPPDFQIAVENDMGAIAVGQSAARVAPVVRMGFGTPIRDDRVRLNAKVRWVTETGDSRNGRIRDSNARLELSGCELRPLGGMANFLEVAISDLLVEFSDERGRRWECALEKDGAGKIVVEPSLKYFQRSLRFVRHGEQ